MRPVAENRRSTPVWGWKDFSGDAACTPITRLICLTVCFSKDASALLGGVPSTTASNARNRRPYPFLPLLADGVMPSNRRAWICIAPIIRRTHSSREQTGHRFSKAGCQPGSFDGDAFPELRQGRPRLKKSSCRKKNSLQKTLDKGLEAAGGGTFARLEGKEIPAKPSYPL